MSIPNEPGPRRIRPGDDLGAVFGSRPVADDAAESGRGDSAASPATGTGPHGATASPAVWAPSTGQTAAGREHPDAPPAAPRPPAFADLPPSSGHAHNMPSPHGAVWGAPTDTASAPAEAVWGQASAAGRDPVSAAPAAGTSQGFFAPPGHGVAAAPVTVPAPAPARASLEAGAPAAPSALESFGITRCLAWSVVLGAAAVLVAFYPAPPLNVAAACLLALVGVTVVVIGIVRGPRTGRGWLTAVLGLVLCAVGAIGSFPLSFAIASLFYPAGV